MKNLHSPFNIKLLLHFHVSAEIYPTIELPCVQQAICDLVAEGAIECEAPLQYKTTPKGAAWVQALCNVPPPTQVFVDEQGRVLK